MLHKLDELGFVAELANVFHTEENAYALLANAKAPVPALRVFRSMAPVNYWRETCETMDRGLMLGGLEALVLASAKLYPGNRAFAEAAAFVRAPAPAAPFAAPVVSPSTSTGPRHAPSSTAPVPLAPSIPTATTAPALVWVHVSDLHFGHGDAKHRVEQERVVAAIVRDAKKMRQAVGVPTFVFVTGDVAFSGKAKQYANASRWLGELTAAVNATAAEVLLVPGNHDVDRDEAKSLTAKVLQEKLWSDERFLDELLSTPIEFEPIWRKQRAYAEFAKPFGAPELSASAPYWSEMRLTPLGSVAIAGLNSSLACFDDRDAPANLVLGATQVHRALARAANDALLIAIHHHPPTWLRDGDNLLNQLQRRPHLDFCGHVHKQGGGVCSPFQGNGMVQFVAGAAHGGTSESTSYSYAWGRLAAHGLDYFPRVWVAARDEFVADSVNFKLGVDDALSREAATLPEPLRNWLLAAVP